MNTLTNTNELYKTENHTYDKTKASQSTSHRRHSQRNRRTEKNSRPNRRLFLKQCTASLIILIGTFFIMRSDFEFGKNCVSALIRCIRYEFDFSSYIGGITEKFHDIYELLGGIF